MKKLVPLGLPNQVSLVMVAYNEAKSIKRVIKEYYYDVFIHLPAKSEFIIYLDKPTDKTPEIALKFAKGKRGVRVYQGKKNLGYAGAMKSALSKATCPLVFYSDSSGKHRAADFWRLVPFIHQFDVVTGNRSNRTDPLLRQITTNFQRILTFMLFGVGWDDLNTGFKLVKKKVLLAVLPQVKFTKQSFSTELLVRAHHNNFSIVGVPVSFTGRQRKNQGTNYQQLPEIIFINTRGLFRLWLEINGR